MNPDEHEVRKDLDIDRCWIVVEETIKRLNHPDISLETRVRRMAIAANQINLLEKLDPDHPGIATSREALARGIEEMKQAREKIAKDL